jgi:L-ascorbate metabolism protein UlaG (beta-lactamase superfamily)
MRITKYGHSCLLVEEGGARILIDPGAFSSGQNSVRGIDAVLITHEHADHLSPDSLRAVLANNPDATVYTNQGAGAILDKEGIPFSVLGDGQSAEVKGVLVEGFGVDHACIHESIPIIRNTGYRITKGL